MQILKIIILLFCLTNFLSCRIPGQQEHSIVSETNKILTAADQTEIYLTLLQDQKVAIVANQTSVINGAHLVDSLLGLGVKVIKVFGPEHGFRGNAADGELVSNEIDQKTSLPVISLYGSNKKPKPEQLNDIDIVIFDIQDV
ncbi:MAG: DUF1343 domain-containing protein, partial [Bacteroidales bacterium]|nr:DUF1343 domain-containing protein [Bacteroidales bacterium]